MPRLTLRATEGGTRKVKKSIPTASSGSSGGIGVSESPFVSAAPSDADSEMVRITLRLFSFTEFFLEM